MRSKNYGMYTKEGNAKVAEIVAYSTDPIQAIDELKELAKTEGFEEASDTAVKDIVYVAVGKSMVFRAGEVAREAHAGQVDKVGVFYIEHPIRVAQSLKDPYQKAVAMLHDVLEDTDMTEEELRDRFPSFVVDAVVRLTHKKGEPYTDYIDRVKESCLAVEVKSADLKDNLDLERLSQLDNETIGRLVKKYTRAQRQLAY